MAPDRVPHADSVAPGTGRVRELVSDAIRFWERLRLPYNLVLTGVVVVWVVSTWPHFRPALTFEALGSLLVLAALANVAYSAAYLADIALQCSSVGEAWRRRRWVVWLAGMLVAVAFASYWIADEIYPSVR